eukprot:4576116-Amphidinium_carterae.1
MEEGDRAPQTQVQTGKLPEKPPSASQDDDAGGWESEEESPQRLMGGIGNWIGSKAKEFMTELGSEAQEMRKAQEAPSGDEPSEDKEPEAAGEVDELGRKEDVEVLAALDEASAQLEPHTASGERAAAAAEGDILQLQEERSALLQLQVELRAQLESTKALLSESEHNLMSVSSERDELNQQVQAVRKDLADQQAAHSQAIAELRDAATVAET